MGRSMSDPAMESQELKKAVEPVKRKISHSSGELSPLSPTSLSFSGTFIGEEVRIIKSDSAAVETQPSGWTVVDVNRDTSAKQNPEKVAAGGTKPPVSAKPKPAPPLKPKPKSPVPDRGNTGGNAGKSFTFTVTTAGGNASSSKTEQPKGTETTTGGNVESPNRFSDYAEILTSDAESKKTPNTSPSGSIKSKMSLFEGGAPVKPAVYAKPDMSQKKKATKPPVSSNNSVHTAVENSKEKDTAEAAPLLPDRHYTAQDLAHLTPTSKPSPPLPPARNSPQGSSPKENRFNVLKPSKSPEQSSQNDVENLYEVVEARNVKPSSVAQQKKPVPSPPPHNKRIESRNDTPPAPPSPFKDRVPPPPVRGTSLSSASVPSSSKETAESQYSEVVETKRSLPAKSESPYSEVEDTRKTAEVAAYFTRDVVRNLPTKEVDFKRKPPPKPTPYKLKTTESDPHTVTTAPPVPAPYRPKNSPGDLSNTASSSDGDRLQSPVTPVSPNLPVVMPGSPRLHSAKLVSDSSPSSTSSSPVLDRPPKIKPPPPPRVSSMADATKEEVTFQAAVPDVSSCSPVNGIAEREDRNEIPTRDFDAVLTSPKPFFPPKPQLGSLPNHINEENGPPSFKPPPPPKMSPLLPRAYGVKSASVTSDRERTGSQNGSDSLRFIAPPPPDWLDGKDERSASTTSVDSLDLKIVPPPPVSFKELDPVNLTFDIQAVDPPSDWQEGTDRNGNVNSPQWGGITDYDLSIVPPPPPPSGPPPTLPVGGPVDYELDLVPSLLSGGPGGLSIEDILGDLDKTLSLPSDNYDGVSDDEDSLPPAPLPPGVRYSGVPPPPGDARIKPLVPPLRKQR